MREVEIEREDRQFRAGIRARDRERAATAAIVDGRRKPGIAGAFSGREQRRKPATARES